MPELATILKPNAATRMKLFSFGSFDAAERSRRVRLRFGSFELDPKSGELSSKETNVLLQCQQLQLLLMLIDHAGEIVTRDEIQNRIWGKDVIVDFDHSINTLARKLRRTLGDSAKAPAYIETLARRGYRLKVPVAMIEKPTTNSVAINGSMLSSTTVPAAWKDGEKDEGAASVQSSALRLQGVAHSTKRGLVAPRAFRCRQRPFYGAEQSRDNTVSMVGMLGARALCENLISAAPAERLKALQQLLAFVTHVLEGCSS